MTDANTSSIIIGFLIFVSIVLGATYFTSSNLTSYNLPNSSSELSDLDSNIITLQGNMTVLNQDLEEDFQDSVATDTGSNSFLNVGAIGKVLEKMKAFAGVMLKGINILKLVITSFVPSFVWWLISSIIFFVIMWKLLELWLGR